MADASLTQLGIQTFLPSTQRTVRHARQLRIVETPFFPGFMFVGLNLAQEDLLLITHANGVVGLFADGAKPVPVPAGVVEALAELLESDGVQNAAPSADLDPNPQLATSIADRVRRMCDRTDEDRVAALLAVVNEGDAGQDLVREA